MPVRKGEKGLLLVGHEKMPQGSGLTGDRGGDTADGFGTKGLPEPRTSTSFPEIWYPGLGKGGKEGLCASVGILKDFSILMKTVSHYVTEQTWGGGQYTIMERTLPFLSGCPPHTY